MSEWTLNGIGEAKLSGYSKTTLQLLCQEREIQCDQESIKEMVAAILVWKKEEGIAGRNAKMRTELKSFESQPNAAEPKVVLTDPPKVVNPLEALVKAFLLHYWNLITTRTFSSSGIFF